VILDVDADHLDYFKDLDDVKKSFRAFGNLVDKESGVVIANVDDENTMDAIKGIDRRVMTFGFSENADVRAVNIESKGVETQFDVIYNGNVYSHITLNVPGIHNVKNALAAAASAIELGIEGEAVSRGLDSFGGAARRFQYKGNVNGVPVYDDYAHHPGEIHALIDAVRSIGDNRIVVAFQPHTYSRTSALFDDFVKELSLADKVFLAEIFAARETNTIGISSKDLAEKIPGSVYCKTFDEMEKALRAEVKPGDILLTVGAGDIYTVGERLVK
jgi:UDP-N-acetylmuramate--alanine ligase